MPKDWGNKYKIMEQKYTREEIIELYLQNKLSEEERVEFEQHMKNDELLSNEVDLVRHIITGIQRKGDVAVFTELKEISTEEQLKEILAKTEKRHRPNVPKRRLIIAGISSIAAVAIILLFIGLQPQYSSMQLYQQTHNRAEIDWSASRGGISLNATQLELLDHAIQLYQQQDYAGALSIMEQITEGKNLSDIPDEILFYSAICLSENNRNMEAIEMLKFLSGKSDSLFYEEAAWQLSLVYLKKDKRDEARKSLLRIIETKGFYAKNAEALLDHLNKKKWF